ncbi:MAG: hypothetical protein R3300_00745 [Candidatus Promineifilaceae bacterium]|nr:hypothetical protein [Candidatus Promineifilaceae bacterium]
MSQQSKRELVEALRSCYLHAGRAEKTKMLNEFVAVTGFHRKHAIRVLRQGYQRGRERRGRLRVYTGAVVNALVTIWRIAGESCGNHSLLGNIFFWDNMALPHDKLDIAQRCCHSSRSGSGSSTRRTTDHPPARR